MSHELIISNFYVFSSHFMDIHVKKSELSFFLILDCSLAKLLLSFSSFVFSRSLDAVCCWFLRLSNSTDWLAEFSCYLILNVERDVPKVKFQNSLALKKNFKSNGFHFAITLWFIAHSPFEMTIINLYILCRDLFRSRTSNVCGVLIHNWLLFLRHEKKNSKINHKRVVMNHSARFYDTFCVVMLNNSSCLIFFTQDLFYFLIKWHA